MVIQLKEKSQSKCNISKRLLKKHISAHAHSNPIVLKKKVLYILQKNVIEMLFNKMDTSQRLNLDQFPSEF